LLSPAVDDGVVYVGNLKGTFFALDAITGEEIWERPGELPGGSGAVLTNTALYVGEIDGTVSGMDRATGTSDFQLILSTAGYGDPIYSSPTVSGGSIFVADSAGLIRAHGDIRTSVSIVDGMTVEVVGETTALRAAPSNAGVTRGELTPGTRVRVMGSPEERDGLIWWPVEAEGGGTGWVPESAIVAAEVPPTPVPTPDPTSTPSPQSAPTPTSVPATSTPEPPPDHDEPGESVPPAPILTPNPNVRMASYCLTSPLYPPGTEIVLPRSVALLVERPGFDPSSEPIDPPDYYDPTVARFRPSDEIPSGTVVEITGPHVETGTCDVWPIRYQMGFGTVIEGYIDERELRPAE
jgi:hypothetical protein